jgi:hypothetical protein
MAAVNGGTCDGGLVYDLSSAKHEVSGVAFRLMRRREFGRESVPLFEGRGIPDEPIFAPTVALLMWPRDLFKGTFNPLANLLK